MSTRCKLLPFRDMHRPVLSSTMIHSWYEKVLPLLRSRYTGRQQPDSPQELSTNTSSVFLSLCFYTGLPQLHPWAASFYPFPYPCSLSCLILYLQSGLSSYCGRISFFPSAAGSPLFSSFRLLRSLSGPETDNIETTPSGDARARLVVEVRTTRASTVTYLPIHCIS